MTTITTPAVAVRDWNMPGLLAAVDQLSETAWTAHQEALSLVARVRSPEAEIARLRAEYEPTNHTEQETT